MILRISILAVLALHEVTGLDNGLGRTPQMGWNSWNHYGCRVNQTVVEAAANSIIEKGLDKLGYKYVNVDDCWAKSRDSKGVVQPDPATFPDFQGMIDHVHSKGLLFGLYSDAGTMTCQKRPGSKGYEEIDAKTYAAWKVDYLKYDNCNNVGVKPEDCYPVMRDALNKTGRPIFYSMCEEGKDQAPTWAAKVGNSWRTSGDIRDDFATMVYRADQNDRYAQYAAPGGWNDPDMLEIGNGGMSTAEYETHMSLWCLIKSPLLIGCDVTNMSADTIRILSNTEVIAVNQDPMGVQGKKVKMNGTSEVWAGPLDKGKYAVVLLNRGNTTATIEAQWSDFGLDNSRSAMVRDLWKHADVGTKTGSISSEVPSHGVMMHLITPQ